MGFDNVYGENIQDFYPNVRVTIERIYPSQARQMLQTNVGNRNMKSLPIAEAIQGGWWKLNGATIVFDEDGGLIDGQNRLHGCVKANKPIDTIVVRGIPRTAQASMDSGIKRSISDNLTMLGYKNGRTMESVGRSLLDMEIDGFDAVMSNTITSKPQMQYLNWIVENDNEVELYVRRTRNFVSGIRRVRCGYLACVMSEIYKIDEDDADEFFKQVGYATPTLQQAQVLRQVLLKNSLNREGGFPQRHLMAIIVKAWNAYINGEQVNFQTLRFRTGGAHPESFPKISNPYVD